MATDTLENELDQIRKLNTHTVPEIDEHLVFISNVIKHSKKRNKKECFKRADAWLDLRLELTNDT